MRIPQSLCLWKLKKELLVLLSFCSQTFVSTRLSVINEYCIS
jgi:hypothetical protein